MGLGVSGVSAARLLAAEGARVTAIDHAAGAALEAKASELRKLGVNVVTGCNSVPGEPFDVAVVSPGIAADSAWVRDVVRRGTLAISELELGYRRCACPLLAVTGTNGKSTLVKLCGDALAAAGLRAALAGNYGRPLCDVASESGELDWIVVEVSSFQLETVAEFRPRVGVLLNIQPNHLDRHRDLRTYGELKARLFARMGRGDMAVILDRHVDQVRERVEQAAGNPGDGVQWTSFGLSAAADYRYENGAVFFRRNGAQASVSLKGSTFANPILGQSGAAAVAALNGCGIAPEIVAQAARRFEPLPHRMRQIAEVRGVRFVDDSKATTLAALEAALQMSDGPVRLIAGGLLKEHDLAGVKEMLVNKTRGVYLIGQDSGKLAGAWGDAVVCRECGTLDRAVRMAWAEACGGEVILLAPGCASFDQFKSYEDRGNQFITIVRSFHEE